MKLKVTFMERHTETKTVEVAFPYYRRHELDHSTIYTKIEHLNDGKFQVTKLDIGGTNKIEAYVSTFRTFSEFGSNDSEDYTLGRGEYECSEEEYLEAVQIVKALAANL